MLSESDKAMKMLLTSAEESQTESDSQKTLAYDSPCDESDSPIIQEHIEYVDMVKQSVKKRVKLPLTKPVVYQHGTILFPAVAIYKGCDDSSRLVRTGIVWTIFRHNFEVVLVMSLGYKEVLL